MLFRREHVEPILSGKKKQTRRTWNRKRVYPGRVYQAKTKMISKDYFAKILVTDIYPERLGDITEEDARKEGYSSREAFFEEWRSIYGSVNDNLVVWVVEFEVSE